MAEEKMETKLSRKYSKPSVNIGVNVDTSMGAPVGDSDWRKEEHKRLTSEVSALEKELASFSAEKAAKKVKTALEIQLKLKKLRLQECKLKLNPSY